VCCHGGNALWNVAIAAVRNGGGNGEGTVSAVSTGGDKEIPDAARLSGMTIWEYRP
jgi:hypothetical protein